MSQRTESGRVRCIDCKHYDRAAIAGPQGRYLAGQAKCNFPLDTIKVPASIPPLARIVGTNYMTPSEERFCPVFEAMPQ